MSLKDTLKGKMVILSVILGSFALPANFVSTVKEHFHRHFVVWRRMFMEAEYIFCGLIQTDSFINSNPYAYGCWQQSQIFVLIANSQFHLFPSLKMGLPTFTDNHFQM